MPQIDTITFFPQIFWVGIIFSFWFAVASICVLPSILQTLNARTSVLGATDTVGSSASSGLAEVYNDVVETASTGGESECDVRLANISKANVLAMAPGDFLSNLITKATPSAIMTFSAKS